MLTERSRIRPNDCLSDLLADLKRQGRSLRPYDHEAQGRWLDAGGHLLSAVPDLSQRQAWALQLAASLHLCLIGIPCAVVVGQLLVRATEAERCEH